MSTEFIVSTIIGVVGLVLAVVQLGYFGPKKKNMVKEMTQLVDKKISDEERRKILRDINKKLGGKISTKYIENFELNGRGKEDVYRDICDQNNISPSQDLSQKMLGYKLKYMKNNSSTNTNVVPEVNSTKQQVVYMSELLKERHPVACKRLTDILTKHNIEFRFLKGTKDIWCRDYMPIQNRTGEFIQFTYDPSYLKGNKEWEDSRSDVHEVCEANGIKPIYSDIKIDGGNVVLYGDKVILTDRIYKENPDYDKNALVSEIERLLKAKVIIIPSYRSEYDDFTGHADGMVRFVNESTILGNELKDDYQYIKEGINTACKENGLSYIEVPYFTPKKDKTHDMSAVGIYVNYLEVGNLIIIPKFGVEGNKDTEVEELFRKIFPNRIIETIDYNEVALEGGILNCTTWTIKE